MGQSGRQNMLWPYLKIWEWELIFGRAVKAISSLVIHSLWSQYIPLSDYIECFELKVSLDF
jgi:hypothetical protein